MRIAVNTRFLLKNSLEGYGYFILEVFKRIVLENEQHEFIFIFDRPYDESFVFGKNVKAVVTGPPARHPLLWKLWYDVKVPTILKRYKADIFISCDGFCSLTTSVPQYLVIHDLSFLHYPSFIKRSHLLFYKHFTQKFLDKAQGIATVSDFSKTDIVTRYNIHPEKIAVVYNGVKSSFVPVSAEVIEAIKLKYTDGQEYFICTGSIHPRKNLMNLLKAFSVFKKRQKTNWKLVLTGRLAWKYDQFIESLKSYKYRQDVVMTGYLEEEELAKLVGSAYALVYPSFWEGFGVPVVEAMRCGVPVITSGNSAMEEIAGEAALYADPADHQDIADKMMLLYKDERLREKLIEKGKLIETSYSWDRTADLLWNDVLRTVDIR